MIPRLCVIAIAALALAGCHGSAPAPTIRIERTAVAGITVLELFPSGATEASPLIVALHGKGGSPDRMSRLWDDFAVPAEIVIPQGPISSGTGFEWFEVTDPSDDPLAAAMRAADAKLWPAIHQLAHGRPIILTGFSQGAMMTYAEAALHGSELTAALPVAGALPPPLWPKAGMTLAPIYALHGTADEVLPIEWGRAAVDAFRAAGGTAELHELPGVGHTPAPFTALLHERVSALIAAQPHP